MFHYWSSLWPFHDEKEKGVPWPSGVFGYHLCCATRATGAFISTITTKSEDAFIAVAGRFQRSGLGTAYGLTFFLLLGF